MAIRDEEEVLYDDINKCSVAVAIYGRDGARTNCIERTPFKV